MSLPSNVAAVFNFSANWSASVTESREYKTDIIRSSDGTEQRRALRCKPRRSISYEVLLEDRDARHLSYALQALQPHIWMLPLWHQSNKPTGAIGAGDTALSVVQPLPYDLRGGDYIVLTDSGSDADYDVEVCRIASVAVDRLSVSLDDEIERDWPKHTVLYPAAPAQLSSQVNFSLVTSSALRAAVDFLCAVDRRPSAVPPASADLVVGDLEVLLRPINWASTPEMGYTWEPLIVDAEIGPMDYATDGDFSPVTRKGAVICETRAEAEWWMGFFDRCRGRQQPFLLPGWISLALQYPVTEGSIFEVPGTELGIYLADDQIHTHLMIILPSGDIRLFEISAVVADAEFSVTALQTSTAWAEAVYPWQCPHACLVSTCRLASDRLEVSWITDQIATIQLAVQTVRISA